MKKVILLIALFTGLQLNFAQDNDMLPIGCADDMMNTLQSCLQGSGINYTFVYSGSNSIYVIGKGNPPPGKITSCIAQYNNDGRECPDAPVLINNPHLN